VQPHAVEERGWRAAHTGHHGVTRVLERKARRPTDAVERRPRFVVQEDAARRQHRGDVARRQRQFLVVEVGQDIGRDHEVEGLTAKPLGHDIERHGRQGAGGRAADADPLPQAAVRRGLCRGSSARFRNRAAERIDVLLVFR